MNPVKRERLDKGWTQEEPADRIGVKQATVAKWERQGAVYRRATREKPAKVFGIRRTASPDSSERVKKCNQNYNRKRLGLMCKSPLNLKASLVSFPLFKAKSLRVSALVRESIEEKLEKIEKKIFEEKMKCAYQVWHRKI